MNRETKLALILGLGVFLVVGVLVGDHFSKARQPRAVGDLAGATGEAVPAHQGTPLIASQAPGGPAPAIPNGSETGSPSGGAGEAGALKPPAEISMGGRGNRPAVETATEPMRFGPARTVNPVYGSDVPGGGREPSADSSPGRSNGNGGGAVPHRNPSPGGLPLSKGRETMYVVKPGDTLSRIAGKVYGDGQLWKQLADYNKNIKPENMREGTTLRVPPRDVLLKQAVLDPANAGASGEPTPGTGRAGSGVVPDKTAPRAPAGSGSRTYTVKRGDTLGAIASSQLGSTSRWREILDLNTKVLADEDTVREGMVLKLPSK